MRDRQQLSFRKPLTPAMLVGILLFFGYATIFLEHFSRDVVLAWTLTTPLGMLTVHVLIRHKVNHRLGAGQRLPRLNRYA